MVGGLASALLLTSIAGSVQTAPTLRELVELTDLSSIAVSPDGLQLAFRTEKPSVANNDFELAWYVVPTDGSAPARRIADAGEGERRDGELVSDPPIWTADGYILFRKVANGEIQIWRAAIDGSRSAPITHDPANIRRFALAGQSGVIVYSTGATRAAIAEAEEREYDRGVLIDAHVDPARPLHRGAWIEGRWATDRLSGRWFAFDTLLADRPPTFRAIDWASGTVRAAFASEAALLEEPPSRSIGAPGRSVTAAAQSGDGRGDAFVTAEGLFSRLSVHRAGGRSLTCDQPLCRQRIGKIAWQGKHDAILFSTTDRAAAQSLHLWDVTQGTVRRIVDGVGRWKGGRDERGCTVDDAAAYCVAADANRPPRLVRIDLVTGRVAILADPNRTLVKDSFLQFQPLEWTGLAGQRFAGQLLLPRARGGRLALFVTYYLCDGYLRGGVGDEFPLRQLAAAGIATLCINRVPISADLGDQAEQYELGREGVSAAVDLLAKRGIIDPARVGMGGVSFGGETTMWIAQHSTVLSAISVANTLLSPTYYWFNALPGSPIPPVLKQVWGIGRPEDEPERWQRLSPVLATNTIDVPLLMQLPEREFRFNIELAARLAQAAKPVELWAFPQETHLKYQPRHKVAVYQRNLDWFRFWLQNHVDPDPNKAEQYRRWEAMKHGRASRH